MAITVVQAKAIPVSSGTTFPGSFNSTPTVGNAVIALSYANADGDVTGVADNQSNTYTQVIQKRDFQNSGSSSGVAACYWCPAITTASGTFTVTVTPTSGASGGSCAMLLLEVSGLTGTVDQTGGDNGGSATATSVNPTCTAANSSAVDLAVYSLGARFATGNNAFYSAGATSGWTSTSITTQGSNGLVSAAGYKILSAVETTSALSQTLTAGVNSAGIVATFKGVVATIYLPYSTTQFFVTDNVIQF